MIEATLKSQNQQSSTNSSVAIDNTVASCSHFKPHVFFLARQNIPLLICGEVHDGFALLDCLHSLGASPGPVRRIKDLHDSIVQLTAAFLSSAWDIIERTHDIEEIQQVERH